MGFLDVVGDVAGAIGDGVGDAASWVGDRASDVGSAVGDFFSGNVGTQAQAAPDFVPKILASSGAPDWHDGAQTATSLASAHNNISAQVQKMSAGLESVWTGSGSEAAQAKIKPLADVANAASQTFTSNAQNLSGLAHGFESMKQSLTPMPPTPPQKNFGDVASPWDTDTEKQINQYNQDAQQNVARYSAYSQQAQAAGQALKVDYGQIDTFNGGNISLVKPPTPPPSKKVPPDSRVHSLSNGKDSSVSGPGQPTHNPGQTQETPPPGPPSQQQHVPVSQTGLPSGSQTDGTHSSSYTPPPTSTTDPGFTSPPYGSSGGAGGNSSSGGLGSSLMGGAFGPGGGSFSGGSGGGAGSGGSSSSIGSRLNGAGNSSGAGATGEGAPGRASAGSGASTGAAGSRGASGMGGAGGKGKGEEDAEHQRKYGLDDDSAFSLVDENGDPLVDPNTGMSVAPPTLGG
ncbi:MAG: hypothetical protein JWQ81_8476 [Amycolatopsis sp.]|uniref:hypothetical protein n=1 Tax=Amycolatopsis sp. TaxID=37632 RepID=UPI00261687C7|nr:hypothetical protein [Amycolatopsis sp.]MCU1687737.1 hypothetical protein [Amycolatopsis sp.]